MDHWISTDQIRQTFRRDYEQDEERLGIKTGPGSATYPVIEQKGRNRTTIRIGLRTWWTNGVNTVQKMLKHIPIFQLIF